MYFCCCFIVVCWPGYRRMQSWCVRWNEKRWIDKNVNLSFTLVWPFAEMSVIAVQKHIIFSHSSYSFFSLFFFLPSFSRSLAFIPPSFSAYTLPPSLSLSSLPSSLSLIPSSLALSPFPLSLPPSPSRSLSLIPPSLLSSRALVGNSCHCYQPSTWHFGLQSQDWPLLWLYFGKKTEFAFRCGLLDNTKWFWFRARICQWPWI